LLEGASLTAAAVAGYAFGVQRGALGVGLSLGLAAAAVALAALLFQLVLGGSQARARARADQALLASIVDSSDDAIVGKTLQGVVTTWNTGAVRMFGYRADQMVGHTLERLFPPGLFPEEADILARVGRGERIQHYETTRVRKDGQEIEVSVSISPVRDEAGRVVGASKIARDVTEQRLVRGRLQEVQTELFHVARLADMSQLATGLAHELNQPLSAISNYISGAEKLIARGDLASAQEGCRRAAGQVARAGDVIRRLRDFLRKSAGEMRAESVNDVVAESGALALVGAHIDSVKLELQLAPDAPNALMDKVQI
jgi:two-component system sensor kinase FixL